MLAKMQIYHLVFQNLIQLHIFYINLSIFGNIFSIKLSILVIIEYKIFVAIAFFYCHSLLLLSMLLMLHIHVERLKHPQSSIIYTNWLIPLTSHESFLKPSHTKHKQILPDFGPFTLDSPKICQEVCCLTIGSQPKPIHSNPLHKYHSTCILIQCQKYI